MKHERLRPPAPVARAAARRLGDREGKPVEIRETVTDITPSSFTQILEAGPAVDALKPILTDPRHPRVLGGLREAVIGGGGWKAARRAIRPRRRGRWD